MDRVRTTSLAVSTLGLAVLTALAPSGAGAQGTVPNCTPATNIEAIIDDSGSMASSDFNELRRTGLCCSCSRAATRARRLERSSSAAAPTRCSHRRSSAPAASG